MQAWDEIVKAATVGTARLAPSLAGLDEPAASVLDQLPEAVPEQRLLWACGLLAACRRAGFIPPASDLQLPLAAEPDERPCAPRSIVQTGLILVGGAFPEALHEWLEQFGRKGWRIPDEQLPEFLDFGRWTAHSRAELLPILGKRGRWLASQNPVWNYAAGAQNEPEILAAALATDSGIEAAWLTGSPDERTALLRAVRRTDPARARALMESTWKQDSHEERAAFLMGLIAGLSAGDEPLLEAALDDRRKEVRTMAQRVLRKLPDSQYGLRMWKRLEPLVRLKTPLIGRASLSIDLPDGCDQSMRRDGIEPKSPTPDKGDRQWILEQLVAGCPLKCWTQGIKRSAPYIVSANRIPQWRMTVLRGWSEALEYSPDTEWARALFHAWLDTEPAQLPIRRPWADLVPAPEMDERIVRLVEEISGPIYYGHPILWMVDLHSRPWSVRLTQAFLTRIRNAGDSYLGLCSLLQKYAPHVGPESEKEFMAAWDEAAQQAPAVKQHLVEYIALNEFRTEMRRKFAEV